MTKRQKAAVRIAKDVIAQLKAKNFSPTHIYTAIPGYYSADSTDDLKQHLKKLRQRKQTCGVCALGACFLSEIRKNDNFPTGSVIHRGIIEDRLREIFSPEQLDLIESAYEQQYMGDSGLNSNLVETAIEFGEKYDGDTDRLNAIMRNIIAHNGEFVPRGLRKAQREEAQRRAKEVA